MADSAVLISADEIFSGLVVPADTERILIAYSGGLDSHVLLHLLHGHVSASGQSIRPVAIHINHHLNPQAAVWAEHCREVCARMPVEFTLVELDARAPKGESQEAWARRLRYDALMRHVGPGDVLMTAHHRDDMAETLLIQLFRGAGPSGLAAMPPGVRFGEGWHYRPLLQHSRADLHAYALQHGLVWIEDDSNVDVRYDRNLLRNSILPALKQRWPALSTTLYRAARLQAEASALLEGLAAIDLQQCALNDGRELRVSALLAMPRARAANVLRHWIRLCGHSLPTERRLDEIFASVLGAGPESAPCVTWVDTELRRYRDCLFIIRPLPQQPAPAHQIAWDLNTDCQLVLGRLQAHRGRGEGLRSPVDERLQVRFRHMNERIRVAGHWHELRKLFQQYGVPTCYRDYVPLLYAGDTLVTIPGIAVADGWRAGAEEPGWKIIWTEMPAARPGTEMSAPGNGEPAS